MLLGVVKSFGKLWKYKYEQSIDINRAQNLFHFVMKLPILPLNYLTNGYFRALTVALFFRDISRVFSKIEGIEYF